MFKSLIIQTTLQCPLRCAHCITDSSPFATERLSLDTLVDLIVQASEFGIETIGLTGGDPFLLNDDLNECCKVIHERKMKCAVVTSAYWATSIQRATSILRNLPPIHMLGISADMYHEDYVSFDRVKNAALAGLELNIPSIVIQVTDFEQSSLEKVKKQLGPIAEGVRVQFQKIWPIARAKSLAHRSKRFELGVRELNLSCPMGAPFITTKLKVIGCCSALYDLGAKNPLILGDLKESTLSKILASALLNNHYMLLRNKGLGAYIEELEDRQLIEVDELRATDVCHLCHKIHSKVPTLDQDSLETTSKDICAQ